METSFLFWTSGIACGILLSLTVWYLFLRNRPLKTGSGVFTIPKDIDEVSVCMRGGGGGGSSGGLDIKMKKAPR